MPSAQPLRGDLTEQVPGEGRRARHPRPEDPTGSTCGDKHAQTEGLETLPRGSSSKGKYS